MLLIKHENKELELPLYLFDSMGLTIIRNAIPMEQIEKAKAAINSVFPLKKPWKFSVLNMGEIFLDLLINEKMLKIANHCCGDQFRLDHAFGVSSDVQIVNLHGGPASSFGSCFSQIDNSLYVGQLSCGIVLSPQSRETGGMCYIPGSHKSSDKRSGREIKKQLFKDQIEHESIVVPTLNAGDLVVFTESLIHGDSGWNANYSRLNIYYKFSPGFMAWRDPREQEKYRHLARTDLERRLLEPPWSGQFSDSNFIMSHNNTRKEKTL